MIFKELEQTIALRKKQNANDSYTKKLLTEHCLAERKVNEEAYEVIEAAFNKNKIQLINELSDLFYHVLVLMSKHQITLEDIIKELIRRKKS